MWRYSVETMKSISVVYAQIISDNNSKRTRWLYCVECHNTVLGEEALLIDIVPVCYVKQVGMGRPSNIIISLHGKKFQLLRIFH